VSYVELTKVGKPTLTFSMYAEDEKERIGSGTPRAHRNQSRTLRCADVGENQADTQNLAASVSSANERIIA
jgi:hypothetical protein